MQKAMQAHAAVYRTQSTLAQGVVEMDRILAKISDNGLHSLTEAEKRLLRRASEQRGV